MLTCHHHNTLPNKDEIRLQVALDRPADDQALFHSLHFPLNLSTACASKCIVILPSTMNPTSQHMIPTIEDEVSLYTCSEGPDVNAVMV